MMPFICASNSFTGYRTRISSPRPEPNRRIILTFDLDFGEILALSAGATVSVILFRLHNPRTPFLQQRLARVLEADTDALNRGAIVVVEDGRHRVRDQPITDSP